MSIPNSLPIRRIEGQHVVALQRVEPVGRLVEQHELRVVGDRPGELHALPLPGRHRADRPESLLPETDLPERVVRALDGRARRQAVQLGEVAHEIGRVHVGGQVVVLGGIPDPRADADARRLRIVAEDDELSGVAPAQAEDRAR